MTQEVAQVNSSITDTPSFSCAKLTLQFDELLLKKDLESAQKHFATTAQVGPYHDGSWRGITLRSFKGNLKPFSVIYQGEGENTEVMQHCPYFQKIFDNFPCPINTARLLFLPPGKVIGKHRDHFSIKTGLVRLHIPIITHEKVIFKIANQIMQWKAGELWFGNFAEIHSVENQSDITRVHLVLDCTVTEALLNYFPENFLAAYRKDIRIPLERDVKEISPDKPKLTGYFKLPKGIIRPHLPLLGKIETQQHGIQINLLGAPVTQSFIPVSENHFAFIDFELIPAADNQGFRLLNQNRAFSAEFKLTNKLALLEKLQMFSQIIVGKGLYFSFRFAVFISHCFRKLVKPGT